MSNLKSRVKRLEDKSQAERSAVAICADCVWDVVKGEPFTGDVETAVVIAYVNMNIEDL